MEQDTTQSSASAMRLLRDGLASVIAGKDSFLEQVLACFAAGGHLLIEDLPGLGKTTVARTLAALIARDAAGYCFKRIQCTPDLLPYDITGVDVFNPDTRRFEFQPGPVFTHVLLADEINRTTPKVQSALLEVMAEGQVTVGHTSHVLPKPFFVIATQNPVEFEGTYSLPLAQADRFMMNLSLGYPDVESEVRIVRDNPGEVALAAVEPVCSVADILEAQKQAAAVFCDESLVRTAVAIARASRDHRAVRYGVSPRGALMLVRAARGLAYVRGRSFVSDQDLLEMAPLVLAHRIKLKDSRADAAKVVREIALPLVKQLQGAPA